VGRIVEQSRAARGAARRMLVLGSAGGLGLVAVLLAAGMVMASMRPSCAAVLPAPMAATAATAGQAGRATFYTATPDGLGIAGSCSLPGPPSDGMYVALSTPDYAAGARCGGYVDVTGPAGNTIRVKVIDQCPPCEAGHLDLSPAAFARLADPVKGIIPISFRYVANPPLPGPLSIRVKEGSSRWWLGLLVIDHGNPLTRLELQSGATWRALTHTDYNYWLA